ncbi:MAG: TIGR01777 family protein [Chloroflexi bacterium]|nr:TIGR01777 family protein [Chloroflexota bacterium]
MEQYPMTKRIAITGATGLIGSALATALIARDDHVVAFSRTPHRTDTLPHGTTVVQWNPADTAHTAAALAGCDTVVNLVGASIAGRRWSVAYKQRLEESRITATTQLLNAIGTMTTRPHTFISSSGAGYYGIHAQVTSEQAPAGYDYLAKLCVAWEAAAHPAHELGMRLVIVRTGVVLDKHAGALPLMALPFRLWVGGPVLPGHQAISWIHRDDMVQLLLWSIDGQRVNGPYNACAPEAVDNMTFGKTIARTLQVPMWLPVPQFALRLLFGEMADALLIGGQSVVSSRLPHDGFVFKYPTLAQALTAIYRS